MDEQTEGTEGVEPVVDPTTDDDTAEGTDADDDEGQVADEDEA